MKTTLVTLLAAASAIALSLPAAASEPTYEPIVNQPTVNSRAAVQAAAVQVNAGDALVALSADGSSTVIAAAPTQLARADVQAQRSAEIRSLALWPDTVILAQEAATRMASRSAVIGAAAAAAQAR
jgi:hypothetical protein